MKPNGILSVSLLCAVFLSGACSWVKDIVGQQIVIDTVKYVAARNPRSQNECGIVDETQYTLVVYFGVGLCSTCTLKMMTIWDSLADKMGRKDIRYYFIFSADEDVSVEMCNRILSQYYFSFPVYLDYYDSFMQDNPFVAEFETPVCILLDVDGNILDYGRPDKKQRDFRRFLGKIRR